MRLVSLNKIQQVLSQICDYSPLSVNYAIGRRLFPVLALTQVDSFSDLHMIVCFKITLFLPSISSNMVYKQPQ